MPNPPHLLLILVVFLSTHCNLVSTTTTTTCEACTPEALDHLLSLDPSSSTTKFFSMSFAKKCADPSVPFHIKMSIGEQLASHGQHDASYHLYAATTASIPKKDLKELKIRTAVMAKQIGKYQTCIQILSSDNVQLNDAFEYGLLAACQHRLHRSDDARLTHVQAVAHGAYPSHDPLRPGGGQEWEKNLVGKSLWTKKDLLALDKGKGKSIVHIMNAMEDQSNDIRDEMKTYMEVVAGTTSTGMISSGTTSSEWRLEKQNLSSKDDGWSELYLYQNGALDEDICVMFPFTCSILRQAKFDLHPQGHVKFSKISLGTHVWPHSGGSNTKLRGHLGVIVPKVARRHAKLLIGEKIVRWKEGSVFLFDDTFEHAVDYGSNRGGGGEEGKGKGKGGVGEEEGEEETRRERKEDRIVLIFDVFHPDVKRSKRIEMRRRNKRKDNEK